MARRPASGTRAAKSLAATLHRRYRSGCRDRPIAEPPGSAGPAPSRRRGAVIGGSVGSGVGSTTDASSGAALDRPAGGTRTTPGRDRRVAVGVGVAIGTGGVSVCRPAGASGVGAACASGRCRGGLRGRPGRRLRGRLRGRPRRRRGLDRRADRDRAGGERGVAVVLGDRADDDGVAPSRQLAGPGEGHALAPRPAVLAGHLVDQGVERDGDVLGARPVRVLVDDGHGDDGRRRAGPWRDRRAGQLGLARRGVHRDDEREEQERRHGQRPDPGPDRAPCRPTFHVDQRSASSPGSCPTRDRGCPGREARSNGTGVRVGQAVRRTHAPSAVRPATAAGRVRCGPDRRLVRPPRIDGPDWSLAPGGWRARYVRAAEPSHPIRPRSGSPVTGRHARRGTRGSRARAWRS